MQAGTALGSVTGSIQVSNGVCWEGELADMTYVLFYSGFSIGVRRTKLHLLSARDSYSSGLFRSALFIPAKHQKWDPFMKQKYELSREVSLIAILQC